jgi:hypothetical protein
MPIKQEMRCKFIASKNISEKKSMYLLFIILIILLTTGYLIYTRNRNSLESAGKVTYPIKEGIAKPENMSNEIVFPVIKKAKLQLESFDNIDKLKIIIEEEGNRKDVKYNYEWFKNGKPYGSNTDFIIGLKKGDKINVRVTPFIDKQFGRPKTLSMEIANVTPKIVKNNEINFDGKVLSYQVKAINPDGGPLKYSLLNPPKGMTINNETGMIIWQVKAEDYGKYLINVRISNNNGGETLFPLSIDIGKAVE